jgi:tetratricopeptide (TPR) repeat protein
MRSSDRRYTRRPPLFLLPLLLLLIGTVLWAAGGGCGLAPGGAVLRTPEEQQQAVEDRVKFAVTAMKRGDTRAADNAIEDAVRLLGGTSDAVVAVGTELSRHGSEAAAVRVLSRWSQKPEAAWDPMLWIALAQAQRGVGNDTAIEPAKDEAARRADEIYGQIGRETPTSQAVPSARTLSAVQRFLQAGLYFSETKEGLDAAKALAVLRAAYLLLPDEPVTLNAYGYTLANLGTTPEQFDQALDLTKQAAAKAEDNGVILDSYGWALFKKNDLAGARRVLRQAADLTPDVPEIRYHLGIVYAAMGMRPQALIEFEHATNLRPGYEDAENEKRRLAQPSAAPAL